MSKSVFLTIVFAFLFSFAHSQISRSEMQQLVNRTYRDQKHSGWTNSSRLIIFTKVLTPMPCRSM